MTIDELALDAATELRKAGLIVFPDVERAAPIIAAYLRKENEECEKLLLDRQTIYHTERWAGSEEWRAACKSESSHAAQAIAARRRK